MKEEIAKDKKNPAAHHQVYMDAGVKLQGQPEKLAANPKRGFARKEGGGFYM